MNVEQQVDSIQSTSQAQIKKKKNQNTSDEITSISTSIDDVKRKLPSKAKEESDCNQEVNKQEEN